MFFDSSFVGCVAGGSYPATMVLAPSLLKRPNPTTWQRVSVSCDKRHFEYSASHRTPYRFHPRSAPYVHSFLDEGLVVAAAPARFTALTTLGTFRQFEDSWPVSLLAFEANTSLEQQRCQARMRLCNEARSTAINLFHISKQQKQLPTTTRSPHALPDHQVSGPKTLYNRVSSQLRTTSAVDVVVESAIGQLS
jgi:hypothetical protein